MATVRVRLVTMSSAEPLPRPAGDRVEAAHADFGETVGAACKHDLDQHDEGRVKTMIRSIITMFLPLGVADRSSVEAGFAAFDESPAVSALSVPVDTAERPFMSSAEAGLMVG